MPRSSFTKAAGTAPLPGYVLVEPLGLGEFAEVWKCQAPDGRRKAVKFVARDPESADGEEQLRRECDAYQRIQEIRHPLLLAVERAEVVGTELVAVTELADRHLGERLRECRDGGLAGIPRDELLGYLRESADALDVLAAKYALRHLNIKPANLLLSAGHVKVGDYGLVGTQDGRGVTPKYAAPETLFGNPHARSDQYSLALVYHELLTGTFPHSGRTPRQFMFQHVSAQPNLSALAEGDRAAVATALSKNPDERFPSCREFVAALERASAAVLPPARRSNGRTVVKIPKSVASGSKIVCPAGPAAKAPTALPKLVVGARRPSPPPTAPPAPTPPNKPASSIAVRVKEILSVVPVDQLHGRRSTTPAVGPADVVRAVLAAAGVEPGEPGAVVRLPDGTWACRFPSTLEPRVARLKLELLWEEGGLTMDTREPNRVVFRQPAPPAPVAQRRGFRKPLLPPAPFGLELAVRLPERTSNISEVVVSGSVFGDPPAEFADRVGEAIGALIASVRRHLGDVEERRKHPRVPADFPVTIFPLSSGGRVGTPLNGRCRDVSAGGLSLVTPTPPPGDDAYVSFEGVPGVVGMGLLVRTVRREPGKDGVLLGCRYVLNRLPQVTPHGGTPGTDAGVPTPLSAGA
ncbi:MAG TPA: serine/threonine-protein kinase [Gemmataceae bacterium]|nr:serine/threonine-protein kinase [Gemmataceae bacterium]